MPFAGIKSRLNGHDIEQVRVEFVQLYINEDRELKDVVEIFRDRGIQASEQQWKTQIALWKISKYNKKDYMTFAARKADQRMHDLGKETAFRINGQIKTTHDIARYLKRRRSGNNKASSPSPVLTPEAMTYFTPPHSPSLVSNAAVERLSTFPSPSRATISYDELASIPQDPGVLVEQSYHAEDRLEEGNRNRLLEEFVAEALQRRSLCPPLTLPEDLRIIECGLQRLRDLFGMTIPVWRHFNLTESEYAHATGSIQSLSCNDSCFREHSRLGNTFTARIFWNKILRDLSRALCLLHPTFLPYFMHFIVNLMGMNERNYYDLLASIHQVFVRSLPKEHCLIKVLRAIELPGSQTIELLERYLLAYRNILIDDQPQNIGLHICVLEALQSVHVTLRDWTSALKMTDRLRTTLNLAPISATQLSVSRMRCLLLEIYANYRLGRHSETAQILDRFDAFVHESPDLPLRSFILYLVTRAEVRSTMGAEDARNDLYAAWQLSNKRLGPSHWLTIQSYRLLNAVLHGQR